MKPDVDAILLANSYFTKCKMENPKCGKTELARLYLTAIIKKALYERNSDKNLFQTDKAFFN
jgi:hypothetical protein